MQLFEPEGFKLKQHSFFSEGFSHHKSLLFTAKLQRDSDGLQIKQTISEKVDGLHGVGQCNFWFKINDKRSIYSRMGSSSNLYLHFDNGIHHLKNASQNLYFGFQFNKTFTQRMAFVGAEILQMNKWSFNSKITYNFAKKGLSLDNKLRINSGNYVAQGFTCFDLSTKTLKDYGFLFCLGNQDDLSNKYILKIENQGKSQRFALKNLVENVVLSAITPISPSQTIGLQTKVNINYLAGQSKRQIFQSLWLCSEWKSDSTEVKVKMNKDLTTALTVRNKLSSFGWYGLGIQASQVGYKNRVKFGVQIDLTL